MEPKVGDVFHWHDPRFPSDELNEVKWMLLAVEWSTSPKWRYGEEPVYVCQIWSLSNNVKLELAWDQESIDLAYKVIERL
jgi:hypothetical protein